MWRALWQMGFECCPWELLQVARMTLHWEREFQNVRGCDEICGIIYIDVHFGTGQWNVQL